MTCTICPHCGFDIVEQQPVADGHFAYVPQIGVLFKGERLKVAAQAHILIGTLMLARGRFVKRETLFSRMGCGEDCDVGTVSTVLSKARRLAPVPLPIEGVAGYGMRWVPGAAA